MPAFLLRFKVNYLENMAGYPSFSLWIPIAPCKCLLFPRGLNLAQKPLYLEGIVLKGGAYCNILQLLPIVFIPCANDDIPTGQIIYILRAIVSFFSKKYTRRRRPQKQNTQIWSN